MDPLFLSPECELYALDKDRAHRLDQIEIKVRNPAATAQEGRISLRYAWLPPSFGAIDKSRDAVGLNANARFPILKNVHGLIFSRNGRVIDVQTRTPWTVFINNDRYIRVEVEFSASLDEMFGVTTSKQQVTVSTAIWDVLREAGLHKAIEQLRGKVRAAKLKRRAPDTKHENAVNSGEGSKTSAPGPSRLITDKVPLLTREGGDAALRPNDNHPLLDGAAPSAEIARALRAQVVQICDRTVSTSRRHRSDYATLLEEWVKSLDHPLGQPGTPIASAGQSG